MGLHSTAPQIMLSLLVEKWMCCMFWCNLMGIVSLWEGNLLSWSASIISLPDICWMVKSYFCTWSNMNSRLGGCCMDGFLLDHF